MAVQHVVGVPGRGARPEAAAIVGVRRDLLARTEVLIREFHPELSAGAVIGAVTRCRDELVRTGVRAGLGTAVETMARARLRARLAACA